MDVYHIAALIIYCFFLGVAIAGNVIWGECDMKRFEVTGPFQVGFQDIYSSRD